MPGTLAEFATLDDIGFIGIAAGRKLSKEDRAFFAQKGEEARQRYYATHSKEHVEKMNRKAKALLEANDRAVAKLASRATVHASPASPDHAPTRRVMQPQVAYA